MGQLGQTTRKVDKLRCNVFLSNKNLSTKIQLVLHVFHVIANTWTLCLKISVFCSNIISFFLNLKSSIYLKPTVIITVKLFSSCICNIINFITF